jgi:hypothetical protein
MITIVTSGTHVETHYTLFPFLIYGGSQRFTITNDGNKALQRAGRGKNRSRALVILTKWYEAQPETERRRWLKTFRETFDRVVFVDDSDSPHSKHYDLLPEVDLFYQKQLLIDRAMYEQEFIGNRMFCDYYAREFNLDNDTDERYPTIPDPTERDKLRVLWNLGYGQYPLFRTPKKAIEKLLTTLFGYRGVKPLLTQPRFRSPTKLDLPKCHARFGAGGYRPLIAYQRELFLRLVAGDQLFLSGRVPRSEYDSELRSVQAVLSPFGWGELCYRDFEAIIGGNVLIKPDVGHIETWPNVFFPGETYVSIGWNGSDLIERTHAALENPSEMRRISLAAQDAYRSAFDRIDERVDLFYEEVLA